MALIPASVAPAELDDSYALAERICDEARTSFRPAMMLLTPERRRSLFAVYAFSRRADDAVDAVEEEALDPNEARARLGDLRRFLGDDPSEDPLAPAFRDAVTRHAIPREHFDALLDGMLMDLDVRRYARFADLEGYCYRAASVVGRACLEIFGHEGPAAYGPAESLGIAMQLVNILRDVDEDMRRDRIYLPLEDLDRFGVTEEDLRERRATPAFRRLMEFEIARARDHFARAEALFPLVAAESRACPLLLARVYSRLLDRIARRPEAVLSGRVRVSKSAKAWLLLRAWIESP